MATTSIKTSEQKAVASRLTGAEYIAEFLYQRGLNRVFLITGGACAFMVDAIARHPELDYVCLLHEQSAAMAADAVWRVRRKVGAAMATSGPGATNLLTGIACSYFDSIPTLYITGQVNQTESSAFLGAQVRQAGFQETNIVDMVKPITKYAVQVKTVSDLKRELPKALQIATSGRMGPVLIDVPMNVQKDEAGEYQEFSEFFQDVSSPSSSSLANLRSQIEEFFRDSERPLALLGAGIGLAGVSAEIVEWLEKNKIPFVSSWLGTTYFNHDCDLFCGNIGVYGNRGANYILQNCDVLLVLGSRLDNRQRSGNTRKFVPKARVFVVDIDSEELKKYAPDGYETAVLDMKYLPPILGNLRPTGSKGHWLEYVQEIKSKYFGKDISTFAKEHGTTSPYEAIKKINNLIEQDAIVISDSGACLCWVYQIFHRTKQIMFTAGGMSPMGYALPAAIGAAVHCPNKQAICFMGDGGFQLNIQELQTVKHYNLDIKIVIMNNKSYGIIKQFQDSYLGSRYEASGRGYSVPDFKAVVEAYGLPCNTINTVEEITPDLFKSRGARVINIILDENTLIEPRLEMGRPINDQFPYVSDEEFRWANRFVEYERKKNN